MFDTITYRDSLAGLFMDSSIASVGVPSGCKAEEDEDEDEVPGGELLAWATPLTSGVEPAFRYEMADGVKLSAPPLRPSAKARRLARLGVRDGWWSLTTRLVSGSRKSSGE